MSSREIFEKVNSLLTSHPNALLPIIAERLGLTKQDIEQAFREIDGRSFEEFQQHRRLTEAFKQLGVDRTVPLGPWEKARLRPRMIIPKTTVQYRVRSFWNYQRSFSNPCPLVDLSSGGLAFLADIAMPPGKRISLLLKFPDREEALRVEGCSVYSVATGIAGYRNRIGIQFLPFDERRGCNSPKLLEILDKFESR